MVNAIGTQLREPDKFDTSPMAHDGYNGNRSGKREGECGGGSPVSKHQIQPGCGE